MTDLKRDKDGERGGLRLFSLFGIEIRLDVSVVVIFALIVFSLARGVLPQWHPDWSPATVWLTALAAGVVFFASLLAHEMSHALTARRFGIQVPRITLFLFGGVAEIEAEADTPKAEFTIAIAGPLMSLVLGVLFGVGAGLSMSEPVMNGLADDPEQALAALNPIQTASLWLGSVNLMLALFNMVPGFPLDGGRVFRAAIWAFTGNQLMATRIASTAGRWFGWTLIALGLWNLLAERDLGGLWLVLIGWFLSHLARNSYEQLANQQALGNLRVADVMLTRFDVVDAQIHLDRFVEEYLLRSNQQLWPVMDGDRAVGTLRFEAATAVPAPERPSRRVADLMTPLEQSRLLDADSSAASALKTLAGAGDAPVAVQSGGRVVGLVRAADILRWAHLHPRAPQRAGTARS